MYLEIAVSRSTISAGTSLGCRYSGDAATTCIPIFLPTSPARRVLIEALDIATSAPAA